jgi:hypothetical protein
VLRRPIETTRITGHLPQDFTCLVTAIFPSQTSSSLSAWPSAGSAGEHSPENTAYDLCGGALSDDRPYRVTFGDTYAPMGVKL